MFYLPKEQQVEQARFASANSRLKAAPTEASTERHA
jgi:hypothetical protein